MFSLSEEREQSVILVHQRFVFRICENHVIVQLIAFIPQQIVSTMT